MDVCSEIATLSVAHLHVVTIELETTTMVTTCQLFAYLAGLLCLHMYMYMYVYMCM